MLNLIAPGSKNVLSKARLRMCEMRFKPPPAHPEKREDGEPSLTEQLLAGVTACVLEQAYVVLVPLGDPDAPRRPEGGNAIAARTTGKGELVRIEEAEFEASVPTDAGRVVLLEPGWQYACFWTHRCDLFNLLSARLGPDIPEFRSARSPTHSALLARGEVRRG